MTVAAVPHAGRHHVVLLQSTGEELKLPFELVPSKGGEGLSIRETSADDKDDDESLYSHSRQDSVLNSPREGALPKLQSALVLHGLRQPYQFTAAHPVPIATREGELVIKIQAIGLNPIDWKSVDYGFGIPELPYIAGRDFTGVVVKAPETASIFREGEIVLCASTDYRDLRKAAYQEYAIASQHTICKLASHVSPLQGASLGVAYVAAALALGACLGLRLPAINSSRGTDLYSLVRSISPAQIPEDIRGECLDSIEDHERPQQGDWIAIWGGSSTSALFLSQLARLAGLKVILVVDVAKHGNKLCGSGDVLVDSHNPARAVDVIRGVTGDSLRFGVDTVGKETGSYLAQCLASNSKQRAHLVGLAAVPKQRLEYIVYHAVPMKLFHEVPEAGKNLMDWLARALEMNLLALPSVSVVNGGLDGINAALDQMRRGLVSGRRLVVPI